MEVNVDVTKEYCPNDEERSKFSEAVMHDIKNPANRLYCNLYRYIKRC